jgi:hypothetical protein
VKDKIGDYIPTSVHKDVRIVDLMAKGDLSIRKVW